MPAIDTVVRLPFEHRVRLEIFGRHRCAKLSERGVAALLAAGVVVLALGCQPCATAAPVSPESHATPPAPAAPSRPVPAPEEPEPTREIHGSTTPGEALVLSGEPLHPGCVSMLDTEANGDRIVQSIDWQGCTSSNQFFQQPYWEDGTFWYNVSKEGDRYGYSVHRTVDERTQVLLTRFQSSHTYASTSYIAVRRGEAIDWSPLSDPPRRAITTLTRLGSVFQVEDVDALVRNVTAR